MTTSTRNPFTTIRTEGALLPVDLLQRIVAGDTALGGLDPESYHLPGSEKLNEAINSAWNRLLGAWSTFQTARGRLGEGDAGTTLTRERWLMPLFQELGYGRLQAAKPVTLEGKEYRVSHAWGEVPIHLVGCGGNLERRQAGVTGAAKSSPHSLVQEYLNRNPNQLWGLLSNGLTLRVLRDNASLTRQAYLEFDLEAMLTGEVYADFVVLWLVCHQSRVETQEGKPETCWLETWSKAAQEQGTRALDKLRDGVEQAITALGGGFLAHAGNTALKARLRSGALTREGYYRQLLRLVYRLIFLFASEDRDLLLDPQASPAARERYLKYYSATHLRQLAEQSRGGRHPDLYATLRLVSAMLGGREPGGTGLKGLGLPVLGSFLFSAEALPDLETAELENSALLSAVRGLAFILDGNTRRSVDYRNLGTRELGSVYESLLELHPLINIDAGTFELITSAGNERKTTGSYYTAEDLIKVLLDSALDPVILQAILRAGPSVEAQIVALLALKVCDPACGSGHFLIAAARRIARRLAQLRSGDEEPSPEITRTALREVIQHCVYGVDINPMSVELCKVNLWLESIEPGKPLSFLEAHIQCGDSLVGVAPGLDISEIPDEAFNPAFGDDKVTASALKKRNKAERAGQMGLDIYVVEDDEDLKVWMARRAQSLDDLPEETAEQVGQKAQSYQEYLNSPQYRRRKMEYDLWTAAFFWKMVAQPGAAGILAPTHEMLRRYRSGGTLPPELVRRLEDLSERLNFLHWELSFPKVFAGNNPGFDCLLGNPPWDMVEFSEKEFFAAPAPDITFAPTNRQREHLIAALETSNPALFQMYLDGKRSIYATRKFFQNSARYPFSSEGRINLYPIFVELAPSLVNSKGRAGIIVPSAISMDAYNANLFGWLIKNELVQSLFDFENKLGLFPAVDSRYRFCLLTLSKENAPNRQIEFCYLCRGVDELKDNNRRFVFGTKDIEIFSPNTFAPPILMNSKDARISQRIYNQFGVFINKKTGDNPWQASIQRMLSLSDPGDLFRSYQELIDIPDHSNWIRLYSGKTIHQFNHRYSSFEDGDWREFTFSELRDPEVFVKTEYYVQQLEVDKRTNGKVPNKWLISYRDIARATDERTSIATIIPWTGCDTHCRNIYSNIEPINLLALFAANLNSIPFDYFARQKVISTGLGSGILEQLPVLPPGTYTESDFNFIASRVLELVYTANDMRPFAEDIGYYGDPFIWDEDRRALLRAELDAYYSRLYGFSLDELRYILDPQDVYGPDFPGETFRVLKEKEMRLYGEYRTRRLVLEAWDRLEETESVEQAARPIPIAIDSSIVVSSHQSDLEINWLPVTPPTNVDKTEPLSVNFRQAVGVAWCLDLFGTGQSISLFDAQKYNYFLQRSNLADLDISYREFAKGPYSPQVTYKAGSYAKNKSFWEVRGTNVVRGRKLKDAVDAAPRVIVDIEQARSLIQQLAQISKDDLGGLATVDFTSRAIFEKGQAITPETIRAYFQSDWPEKAGDGWYTDENITRALEMLAELGLFQKSRSERVPTPTVKETPSEERRLAKRRRQQDVKSQTSPIEQPTLSDFGLYKCGVCGKMVMGFEKVTHEREKHGGKSVEWKKMR